MSDQHFGQEPASEHVAEAVTPAHDADAVSSEYATTEPPEEPAPEAEFPSFWEPGPAEAPKPRRARAVVSWFLAAVLGATAGAGGAYVALKDRTTTGSVKIVQPPVSGGAVSPENPAAAVARAVLPSIVQIEVTGRGGGGLGSGVIYTDTGYIITNNHVIEGADTIQVSLPSGEQLPAALVGAAADIGVDIAVVKVAKTGLPAATFGSTKSVEVGDLAVAVGSPFGLEATVTAGVISALHRNRAEGNGLRFTDAIQTDAPINPGNSGGALADSQGAVIGINTAILGGGGGVLGGEPGNVGVGFAIPIDIARKVADQIIQTGKAALPFIGITGANLPDGKGAHVNGVLAGGPAAKAGIAADDVIVSFDGEPVASMDALISLVIQRNVGDKVPVVIERDGKQVTVSVLLAARSTGG